MTDDYLRRVNESYQGESYGEALFRELAARTGDPDQNYKWRVLGQLELETKLRLRPLVERLGGDTAEAEDNASRGRDDAESMAAKDWPDLMSAFDSMLPKYVRFFEKLEAMAPEGDRELLAAVTAHELAIQDFTKLELEGRGRESVEPVIALLKNPPPREQATSASAPHSERA